jgi:outer membrane protein assembly factor BamB
VPVTNSLCGFTVSGGRAFTQVSRFIDAANTNTDVCVALSITNGAELWVSPLEDSFYPDGGVGYDDGPRTTPTYDNGSVYVLTSHLKLYRLNATNGVTEWVKDLKALYGANEIKYQNAASPLIEDGLIYLNANCATNTLMALSTSNGAVVWRSQNETQLHSTPVLTTIFGVRQVIFSTLSGVVSLNPQTGSLLWKFSYPFTVRTINSMAMSPVVYQDLVFVGGAHAYAYGSVARRINYTNSTWSTTLLWWTNNPAAHWMTPVAYNGFLYGLFGIQSYDSPTAQLKCIDMRTGSVKWSVDGFGRGGTLLVDDHLLIIGETGQLILAKPNTNAYTEVGRFLAIPDYDQDTNKCWNPPAVCDGRVYVRSTSFGACFDLSVPDLKLDPPKAVLPNQLQLTIRTANGSALDSNRVAGLELRASTNLALPLSGWAKLTNALVLTGGAGSVTNLDLGFPRRYFIVNELR